MQCIDLNADLGEGCATDAALMTCISSCNVACGGHAGDAASMRATLDLAIEHRVVAGAHPSYPDPEGFGRRSHFMSGRKLRESLHSQVSTLAALAESAGVTLHHLKPHGALYHDANADVSVAEMLTSLCTQFGLALVGPPQGELRRAGLDAGAVFVAEGFVDRGYDADGQLVARGQVGAVFDRAEQAVKQAVSLALRQRVRSVDGADIELCVDTLCLHGDTPGAEKLAAAVRNALEEQGVTITAPAR